MLHRASSDAGYRLRRAKSGHSIIDRQSESIQVPLHPEHAEKAAVEAYRRAHDAQSYKTGSQSLQKRSIAAKSRSEGSHFDQSRTGGRIGRSRANTVPDSSLKPAQRISKRATLKSAGDDDDTKTITRPRHVVDTRPRAHTETMRPQAHRDDCLLYTSPSPRD